jgi:hypothetical protein
MNFSALLNFAPVGSFDFNDVTELRFDFKAKYQCDDPNLTSQESPPMSAYLTVFKITPAAHENFHLLMPSLTTTIALNDKFTVTHFSVYDLDLEHSCFKNADGSNPKNQANCCLMFLLDVGSQRLYVNPK